MDFIAVTNITQEGLLKLIDLEFEGLPCPSIQIKPFPSSYNELKNIPKDDSLNSYGDISFVVNQSNIFGSTNTISKNDNTHDIYTGDAYSLRMPEFKFTFVKKEFNQLIDKMHSLYKKNNISEYLHDNYDQVLQYSHKNKYLIAESLEKSLNFKFLFLEKAGLLDKFKIFKNNQKISKMTDNDSELKEVLLNINSLSIRSKKEFYKDFIIKRINEAKTEEDKDFWKIICFNKNDEPCPIEFYKHFESDIKILQKRSKRVTNIEKTNELLDKLMLKAEKVLDLPFKNFVLNEISPMFINPKIRDNNKPANLDNVVSYMRRNRGEGEEQGGFVNTNYNRATAINQNKIYSYQDLINNKDLITTLEERLKVGDALFKQSILIEEALDIMGNDDKKEKFVQCVAAIGKNPTLDSTQFNLERFGFICNDLLAKQIKNFAELNNNRQHLYFEAKPSKPLKFNQYGSLEGEQITHVVVPNNVNSKILEALEKTDLTVVKYNKDKNSHLSKMKALYRCRDCFIQEKNNKPKKSRKVKI